MKGMTVVFAVHTLCCRPPLPFPPQPIRSLQRFRSSFPFTALWRPYLTSNKSERGDYSSLSTLYQGHATQCIDQVTLLIPGAWKRQSVPNNTTQTDRLVVSPSKFEGPPIEFPSLPYLVTHNHTHRHPALAP